MKDEIAASRDKRQSTSPESIGVESILRIPNWRGREIPVARSRGGTLAVLDFSDNLIRGDISPWPPPEIVQKLYASMQISAFAAADQKALTDRLGFYCDLQSLHSEDALTWSVFGPLVHADDSARRGFAAALLDLIGIPARVTGKTTFWLWRRLAHPDTLVPGGPEIDFGIQTEDLVVLGEAKWLSVVGGNQGKKRDKDQITLRKEFIEKYGKAVFGNVSNFVILLVAPRVGTIRKRELSKEGLTIFFREIPWQWLCEIDGHPCREDLPPYLKWKREHSIRYEEKLWRWKEGAVDKDGEHIQIRYDNGAQPAAWVGTCGGEIVVQLAKDNSPDCRAAVQRELNFYFVELKNLNPWGYAIHHCSTAANIYSAVRWSYFPGSAG